MHTHDLVDIVLSISADDASIATKRIGEIRGCLVNMAYQMDDQDDGKPPLPLGDGFGGLPQPRIDCLITAVIDCLIAAVIDIRPPEFAISFGSGHQHAGPVA